MKYFLVSDDIGNPIYFDHPNGRMICLPIPTAQEVMRTNFGEKFTSMTCGNTVFVFDWYDQISFTAVSNEDEPEHSLRKQLKQTHDLLMSVFGPKGLYSRKQKPNYLKYQKQLHNLVHTMLSLSSLHQSFLLESVEMLDISDDLRSRCYQTLKKSIAQFQSQLQNRFKIGSESPKGSNQSTAGCVCALLFVGTKLLCTYYANYTRSGSNSSPLSLNQGTSRKSQTWEIDPNDILLLITYFHAHFRSTVQEIQETQIPVTDYSEKKPDTNESTSTTDTNPKNNVNSNPQTNEEDLHSQSLSTGTVNSIDEGEGFISAAEEWDDEDIKFDRMDSDQFLFLNNEARYFLMCIADCKSEIFDDIIRNVENDTDGMDSLDHQVSNDKKITIQNLIMEYLSATNDGTISGAAARIADIRTALLEGMTVIVPSRENQLSSPPESPSSTSLPRANIKSDGFLQGLLTKVQLLQFLLIAAGHSSAQKPNTVPNLTLSYITSQIENVLDGLKKFVEARMFMSNYLTLVDPQIENSIELAPQQEIGFVLHKEALVLLIRIAASSTSATLPLFSQKIPEFRRHKISPTTISTPHSGHSAPFTPILQRKDRTSLVSSGNTSSGAINITSLAQTEPSTPQAQDVEQGHFPENEEDSYNLNLSISMSIGEHADFDRPQQDQYVESQEPLYTPIFLRNPTTNSYYQNPFWVYFNNLATSNNLLTLVMINQNMTGSQEEKDQLGLVSSNLSGLLRNYVDYLLIKERTHISSLSYIHQLPGLVHFIFVDRHTNRMLAPIIGPLHGQQYQHSQPGEMVAIIKSKVWDLCQQAHKYLCQGYYSMLKKSGEFVYSYRLILEDAEGAEIPLDQQVLPQYYPNNSIPFLNPHQASQTSSNFYKDFSKKLRAARCYELYTIYLSILPVNVVAAHDRALLQMLGNKKL